MIHAKQVIVTVTADPAAEPERPRPASSGQQNEACGSHPSVPQLAIAAIPLQQWEEPYQPSQALQCGTIFPSLNKPFYKTGGEFRD